MKKIKTILLITIIFPLLLTAANVGIKLEIAGGPIFAIAGYIPLNEKLELNFSAGGFPEIIFRSDINIRYRKERKWFPFYQAGAGLMSFLRGNYDGKSIVTFQANAAIRTYQLSRFQISPYLGVIYVPNWINIDIKEDLTDLAVVPMLGIEFIYK